MNTITISGYEESVTMAESWEELVSAGQEAREENDTTQFTLGDLSCKVDKQYGKDAIGSYANSIGVQKGTLLRYRDVSKKIIPDWRNEFKLLTWTHFKLCSGQENPYEWLKTAHDDNLTVIDLENRIKALALLSDRTDDAESPTVSSEGMEKAHVGSCPVCGKLTLLGPKELICDSIGTCQGEAYEPNAE